MGVQGHKLLSMYLKDWKDKQDDKSLCGKSGPFKAVAAIQLCPVTWSLIVGQLLMFVFFIINSPTFPRVTATMAFWAYMTLVFATAGLFFLYKTTCADPGKCRHSPRDSDIIWQIQRVARLSPGGIGSTVCAAQCLWQTSTQHRHAFMLMATPIVSINEPRICPTSAVSQRAAAAFDISARAAESEMALNCHTLRSLGRLNSWIP